MYDEDDLLPISGLQHLAFCPRQCALIHIERLWEENRLTAEGRVLHDRVHGDGNETRGDVRIVRGLRLASRKLGLSGIADIVEFHRLFEDDERTEDGSVNHTQIGCRLSDYPGRWLPFPVEYKRGRPKSDSPDAVQLCAQSLCLEEMLDVVIDRGVLYYGQTRRRANVTFDMALRDRTKEMARQFHQLVEAGRLPPAEYSRRCDNCSLVADCQPKCRKSATAYLTRMIARHQSENQEIDQ